jgi:hypothetical protein
LYIKHKGHTYGDFIQAPPIDHQDSPEQLDGAMDDESPLKKEVPLSSTGICKVSNRVEEILQKFKEAQSSHSLEALTRNL